jgi:hypothetical protein
MRRIISENLFKKKNHFTQIPNKEREREREEKKNKMSKEEKRI